MPAGRPRKHVLVVTPEQRAELERWLRTHSTPNSVAKRARIILALDDGATLEQAGATVERSRQTAMHWRGRFLELGLAGLHDAPRSGRPRTLDDARVEAVVKRTLETEPQARTHWSRRSMAAAEGLSADTIGRIWRTFGLKPHLKTSSRLSGGPEFVDKLYDVVGLYLSPPENALVLSVDEKPQIQATEREAPVLPMSVGRPEGHASQYVRHGTTVLFAALEVASGRVIASCKGRRRSAEFVEFLEQIDRETAPELELHLILDNLSTHNSPETKRWLLAHPRFHLHFTATYSSWMNLVESFLRSGAASRARARQLRERGRAPRGAAELRRVDERGAARVPLDQERGAGPGESRAQVPAHATDRAVRIMKETSRSHH